MNRQGRSETIMGTSKYYIYVLVDTSKPYNLETPYGFITYAPFYLGMGTYTSEKTERYNVHYYDAVNRRNINPHKERKIRKLVEAEHYATQLLFSSFDPVNTIEIELVKLLGKQCNGTGILTNISDGGTGGYVWKDNPEAVAKIKAASSLRYSTNNPNSKHNRSFDQTPSHIASVTGNHWNSGRLWTEESKAKRKSTLKATYNYTLVHRYHTSDLTYIDSITYEKAATLAEVSIASIESSISRGSSVNNFKFCAEGKTLKITKTQLKKYLDDGIVRPACIIDNSKYAEIDRNDLSTPSVGVTT